MNSKTNLLEVKNLSVAFATDQGSVPAVKNVSFEIAPGEILAIVGESGSGKTVTSKSVLNMLPETATVSGAVLLTGQNIIELKGEALRSLRGPSAAMVFQEPSTALNPVYPIGWQMVQAIRSHKKDGKRISKKEAHKIAVEMLDRVGIPDPATRIKQYPYQFSGGQKQRIVIATALALNPKLIIADEPTTALDVTVQAEILALLRECRDKLGASILLITHNMGVVADLADKVAVMYQGQIVEQSDVRSIFRNPAHEYTKRLLAAVPKIEAGSLKQVSNAGSQPVIIAKDLNIIYPGRLTTAAQHAVKDFSLTINQGEVVGLVGESGSGKTTIARAIAGLTKASSGSLLVLGHEMVGYKESEFRPIRQRIGFVFQDPASSFNPLLTIGECIAEPLYIHRNSSQSEIDARVTELLDAVQLPKEFAQRFPHELSGGQRQRASLARALALSPDLVIADEPTSALDVSVQARVLELFAQLQRDLGFASLFITHDLAVVNQVTDRVAVLHRGILVEEGPTSKVLSNPTDAYTQQLLASHPVPDPDLQAQHRAKLEQIWKSTKTA